MSLFYKLVDQPSREVAFHYWGWYYTALIWIVLSVAGLAVTIGASITVSTERPEVRIACLVAQVVLLLCAIYIRHVWAGRTSRHADSQLDQIAPDIPGKLTSLSCSHPECPLR